MNDLIFLEFLFQFSTSGSILNKFRFFFVFTPSKTIPNNSPYDWSRLLLLFSVRVFFPSPQRKVYHLLSIDFFFVLKTDRREQDSVYCFFFFCSLCSSSSSHHLLRFKLKIIFRRSWHFNDLIFESFIYGFYLIREKKNAKRWSQYNTMKEFFFVFLSFWLLHFLFRLKFSFGSFVSSFTFVF